MTRHVVITQSWAGRREIPCRIVGETPKRYRIELLEPALLSRRYRAAGSISYVPKDAVREARS